MVDSEYTKFFDSIANECDISKLSEHTLGALFWDSQQGKIDKLEHLVESIRSMFDEVLWDDQARAAYQKIHEDYMEHEK